jgi:formate dehydrogenase subunit beta
MRRIPKEAPMSETIEKAIRSRAEELLRLGEVTGVIGYERSPRGGVRPAFIHEAESTGRLVWNDACTHDLMVYLHDRPAAASQAERRPRLAVVAKPCDVRALNVLIHEGQVQRDEVFIIGVACSGMANEDGPLAHCARCSDRVPVICDTLVGDAPKLKALDDAWVDLASLDAQSPEERLAFWTGEFDRCIRCYACRQACPGCYCFECMAEQVDPLWVGIAHDLPEKAFFHVMRAYHLAGRCVECNACELACPMHVPLSLLNRFLVREVEGLFGCRAGADPDTPPPLATFRKDEDLPL